MWIRSQDKVSLINAKAINNVPYSSQFNGPIDIFRIYAWSSNVCEDDAVLIGRYITEEQALKVLDMIQEQIEDQMNYNARPARMHDDDYWQKVFQMPSISEVEAMLSKEKEWTVEEILKREG